MARTKKITNGVKYTVVLPENAIQQLKELAGTNKISSVNAGVREAVELYIVQQQKEAYKKNLHAAMEDPEFIKRTEDTKTAFKYTDAEIEGMNEEW